MQTGRLGRLGELSGQNLRERRAGSKNIRRRSRPSAHKGKAAVRGKPNDKRPLVLSEYGRWHAVRGQQCNTGDPARVTGQRQPDTREGQAGPSRESERSIAPLKPSNAGGGKGPRFKGSVESS